MAAVDSHNTQPSRTDLYLHSHMMQQHYETLPWTQLAGALGYGHVVCTLYTQLKFTFIFKFHYHEQYPSESENQTSRGHLRHPGNILRNFESIIAGNSSRTNQCLRFQHFLSYWLVIVLLNGCCGLAQHPTIQDRFTFTYNAATV
jgi:hypothetical protein